MDRRSQRRLLIAIAHDLGVLHRREGVPPLYDQEEPRLAELAAKTADVPLPASDALRWETTALIAYRSGYDTALVQASPLARIASPSRARRARGDDGSRAAQHAVEDVEVRPLAS